VTTSTSEGAAERPETSDLPWLDLPWQQPNNTEGTAWQRILSLGPGSAVTPAGAAYLPFPWASWIDAVQRGLRPPDPPLRRWPTGAPVATICQHIWALEHHEALRAAGVTDLFWSHATRAETHRSGLRLHPFPLLPVRCLTHPGSSPPLAAGARRWLYCFHGFHPPEGYLSEVRRWLLALPPRPDALLASRAEWHFEQQVYREQVHGQPPDPQRHRHLDADARAYAEALAHSCFALCPSGAGPNSIRLWEALGFGAIPVILSDTLRLPGPEAAWRQAALWVPERETAVAALPQQLASLRADPGRLAAMQAAGAALWARYGPRSFATDVLDFLTDPDALLRQRALERLAADTATLPGKGGDCEPVEEWLLTDPAGLPLRLRQWRAHAPDGARLLIRLVDERPAPLQERLWGPALRIGADLLARRPGLRWAVSARAPALESLVSGR
jgi:hypothetical protein